MPGAAAPHQLLRVDLLITGTTSSSSNIICHPNCLLPFHSLPATQRAEPCPRAWQRLLRGRQSPTPAKCCSGNSLLQEQAFLHSQPALLSHWKGMDCRRQATGASSLAPHEVVPSTRIHGAGCFPPMWLRASWDHTPGGVFPGSKRVPWHYMDLKEFCNYPRAHLSARNAWQQRGKEKGGISVL